MRSDFSSSYPVKKAIASVSTISEIFSLVPFLHEPTFYTLFYVLHVKDWDGRFSPFSCSLLINVFLVGMPPFLPRPTTALDDNVWLQILFRQDRVVTIQRLSVEAATGSHIDWTLKAIQPFQVDLQRRKIKITHGSERFHGIRSNCY